MLKKISLLILLFLTTFNTYSSYLDPDPRDYTSPADFLRAVVRNDSAADDERFSRENGYGIRGLLNITGALIQLSSQNNQNTNSQEDAMNAQEGSDHDDDDDDADINTYAPQSILEDENEDSQEEEVALAQDPAFLYASTLYAQSHQLTQAIECPVCRQSFDKTEEFIVHMQQESNYIKHKCDICNNKEFKFPYLFLIHLAKQHILTPHLRFKKGSCAKSKKIIYFHSEAAAKKYVKQKTHYKCNLNNQYGTPCTFATSKIEILRRHKRMKHNGEDVTLTPCTHAHEGCTRKFTDKSELKSHVKHMHNETYRFKCMTCSNYFIGIPRRTLLGHITTTGHTQYYDQIKQEVVTFS